MCYNRIAVESRMSYVVASSLSPLTASQQPYTNRTRVERERERANERAQANPQPTHHPLILFSLLSMAERRRRSGGRPIGPAVSIGSRDRELCVCVCIPSVADDASKHSLRRRQSAANAAAIHLAYIHHHCQSVTLFVTIIPSRDRERKETSTHSATETQSRI